MSKSNDVMKKWNEKRKEGIKEYKNNKKLRKLIDDYNNKKIDFQNLELESNLSIHGLLELEEKGIIKRWKTKIELERDKEKLKTRKLKSRLTPNELRLRDELTLFLRGVALSKLCSHSEKGYQIGRNHELLKKQINKLKNKYTLGQMRNVLTNKEFNNIKKSFEIYS